MKKRHSAEQIVAKLRQADVELGKGLKVPMPASSLGSTSRPTTYRWRQMYVGMDPVTLDGSAVAGYLRGLWAVEAVGL